MVDLNRKLCNGLMQFYGRASTDVTFVLHLIAITLAHHPVALLATPL